MLAIVWIHACDKGSRENALHRTHKGRATKTTAAQNTYAAANTRILNTASRRVHGNAIPLQKTRTASAWPHWKGCQLHSSCGGYKLLKSQNWDCGCISRSTVPIATVPDQAKPVLEDKLAEANVL